MGVPGQQIFLPDFFACLLEGLETKSDACGAGKHGTHYIAKLFLNSRSSSLHFRNAEMAA